MVRPIATAVLEMTTRREEAGAEGAGGGKTEALAGADEDPEEVDIAVAVAADDNLYDALVLFTQGRISRRQDTFATIRLYKMRLLGIEGCIIVSS
jgi:hypothetical protein